MPEVATQIREYFDAIDPPLDVDALIDQALAEVEEERFRPIPRMRRGLAIAFAVAAVVVIAGAAAALLLQSVEEPPLITEPPPVTEPPPQTTTTEPQPPEPEAVGGLLGFTLADVPPFRATAEYQSPYGEVILQISYAGNTSAFRMDLVEVTPGDQEPPWGPFGSTSGGPGSYLIQDDGDRAAYFYADAETITRESDYLHDGVSLSGLTAATGQWATRCGEGLNTLGAVREELGPAAIAGRSALHLRCTLFDATWELWLDDQTGVVLRAMGPLEVDDIPVMGGDELFDAGEAGAATFEIIDIDFGPAFGPDTFAIVVPAGWSDPDGDRVVALAAIQPFSARVRAFYDETHWRVYDLWFAGRAGYRLETVHRGGDRFAGPGSIEVWNGSTWAAYNADDNFVYTSDNYREVLDGLSLVAGAYPDLAGGLCEALGPGEHLGRAIDRYRCPTAELWSDPASGLLLRAIASSSERASHEFVRLDLDPTFPPGIFVFDPPPEATDQTDIDEAGLGFDHVLVGQPAPALSGDLIGGGVFDLAETRGSPVVVMTWAAWCTPCVENLAILNEVATQRPDIMFITALVLDTEEAALQAIEEQEYTLPVLAPPAGEVHQADFRIFGIPSSVFINPDGTVAAVFFTILNPDAYHQIFDQAGW